MKKFISICLLVIFLSLLFSQKKEIKRELNLMRERENYQNKIIQEGIPKFESKIENYQIDNPPLIISPLRQLLNELRKK